MGTREQVEGRVREIFAAELDGLTVDMVKPSSRVVDLRKNSDEWALISVVLALECEFKLRIHASELKRLKTVSDYVDYICGN